MTLYRIGGSATGHLHSMLRARSMFYGEVELLQFGQPTRQHALNVLEVCSPQTYPLKFSNVDTTANSSHLVVQYFCCAGFKLLL